MKITPAVVYYRQNLPHYRGPGCIYHCRFSLILHSRFSGFTQDWMFEEVEKALLIEHKQTCVIYAYAIMATHTHTLIQPIPAVDEAGAWRDCSKYHELEKICGRIKGRSACEINKRLGFRGVRWQRESFDRTIRGDRDLENSIDYIHHNPVRWKLVRSPEEYRWTSLRTIYSGRKEYAGWFELETP